MRRELCGNLNVDGQFADPLADLVQKRGIDSLDGWRRVRVVLNPKEQRSTRVVGASDSVVGDLAKVSGASSHRPNRLEIVMLGLGS